MVKHKGRGARLITYYDSKPESIITITINDSTQKVEDFMIFLSFTPEIKRP